MNYSTTFNPFRQFFLLDYSIHFLNHGSFGACPIPVFQTYQDWQRRLENQPVQFLGRDFSDYDLQARKILADYLNTVPSNISFITNATQGVNIVAHSLKLHPGDEILSTDHEYGACEYAWEFSCHQSGARYIRQQIPLPIYSEDEIFDLIWTGITSQTRVIYLSHITSPTALRLPVERICQKQEKTAYLRLWMVPTRPVRSHSILKLSVQIFMSAIAINGCLAQRELVFFMFGLRFST